MKSIDLEKKDLMMTEKYYSLFERYVSTLQIAFCEKVFEKFRNDETKLMNKIQSSECIKLF
jgi:hypothetical protein